MKFVRLHCSTFYSHPSRHSKLFSVYSDIQWYTTIQLSALFKLLPYFVAVRALNEYNVKGPLMVPKVKVLQLLKCPRYPFAEKLTPSFIMQHSWMLTPQFHLDTGLITMNIIISLLLLKISPNRSRTLIVSIHSAHYSPLLSFYCPAHCTRNYT